MIWHYCCQGTTTRSWRASWVWSMRRRPHWRLGSSEPPPSTARNRRMLPSVSTDTPALWTWRSSKLSSKHFIVNLYQKVQLCKIETINLIWKVSFSFYLFRSNWTYHHHRIQIRTDFPVRIKPWCRANWLWMTSTPWSNFIIYFIYNNSILGY